MDKAKAIDISGYSKVWVPRRRNISETPETGKMCLVLPVDVKTELSKAILIMRELALQAGQTMKNYRKGKIEAALKLDGSVVTQVDKEIQKLIVDKLRKEFPDFKIIAEEVLEEQGYLESSKTVSGFTFVIDPIDGTRKFMDPQEKYFGCGIALMYDGEVISAVFYAPEYEIHGYPNDKWSGSLFEASELSEEVILNEKRISMEPERNNFVNDTVVLEDVGENGLNLYGFKVIHETGSDLLTLSRISSGLDGTPVVLANGGWAGSGGAHLWDVVPGAYFIEKAGGIVCNRNGDPFFPLKDNLALHKNNLVYKGEYFAGYPNVIKQLLGR